MQTKGYRGEITSLLKGSSVITICTKNRECYFGEIYNKCLKLLQLGVIADILWYEILNHAKNLDLGNFVVMPNHIHGILILKGDGNNQNGNGNGNGNGDRNDDGNGNGNGNGNVDTGHALYQKPKLTKNKTIGQQRFQNIGKNSVSAIIGSYKSAVSKHAHRLGFKMEWQPLSHDHIIRNNG